MLWCDTCKKFITLEHECPATLELSWPIAFALRAEARRLGITEEEMVERAWDEFVDTNRSKLRRGFLRRPWLLLKPGGFGLLVKSF